MPPASGPGSKSCSKEEVAKLSRVALRTQSGRYFSSDGKLVDTINEATLFAVSFKPGRLIFRLVIVVAVVVPVSLLFAMLNQKV